MEIHSYKHYIVIQQINLIGRGGADPPFWVLKMTFIKRKAPNDLYFFNIFRESIPSDPPDGPPRWTPLMDHPDGPPWWTPWWTTFSEILDPRLVPIGIFTYSLFQILTIRVIQTQVVIFAFFQLIINLVWEIFIHFLWFVSVPGCRLSISITGYRASIHFCFITSISFVTALTKQNWDIQKWEIIVSRRLEFVKNWHNIWAKRWLMAGHKFNGWE